MWIDPEQIVICEITCLKLEQLVNCSQADGPGCVQTRFFRNGSKVGGPGQRRFWIRHVVEFNPTTTARDIRPKGEHRARVE